MQHRAQGKRIKPEREENNAIAAGQNDPLDKAWAYRAAAA
jgi:hypothetical protein